MGKGVVRTTGPVKSYFHQVEKYLTCNSLGPNRKESRSDKAGAKEPGNTPVYKTLDPKL